MSTNYGQLVSQTATLTVISSNVLVNGDNNFAGIFPSAIDYAEGRIYRDLDLPAARVSVTSLTLSSGVSATTLPSVSAGELLAIENFSLLTPAGVASSIATLVPLIPTSLAVIDAIYSGGTNYGPPIYFSRISNVSVAFGPTPDQAYQTFIVATVRPSPLSASNSSTWITQNLPELMQAAVMVFMAGYMRDFGSQGDDPKMAQSWEGQYQMLKASASVDSLRQKFQSVAWSDQIPSPTATPPRA